MNISKHKIKNVFLFMLMIMSFKLSANENLTFLSKTTGLKNLSEFEGKGFNKVGLDISRKDNVQTIHIRKESVSFEFPKNLSNAQESISLEEDELIITQTEARGEQEFIINSFKVDKIFSKNKIDIEKEVNKIIDELGSTCHLSPKKTDQFTSIDYETSISLPTENGQMTLNVSGRYIITPYHIYSLGTVSSDEIPSETLEFLDSFKIVKE